MTANEVKVALLEYYRYKRGFPVVAVEAAVAGWGHVADVVCIDKKGLYWETEVKVTLADLRADKQKRKHVWLQEMRDGKMSHSEYTIPARFYFCVPADLNHTGQAVRVVRELYPYAGLMIAYGGRVGVHRQARDIHNCVLQHDEAWKLVKAQSATLVRTFAKVNRQ